MAAGDADTPEVLESIEARGPEHEDVEMEDADADADVDADADADADGDIDEDVDAEGEPDDLEMAQPDRPPRDMFELIESTSKYLCSFRENDQEIAGGFQRIPNKRLLPDYFDVIKEPIAFSTIRGKLNRRTYTKFTEFVRDVALICHNAQVYNRPSAPIFQDALRLREVFEERLQELVENGSIKAAEAELPDLGELPPVEDSPPAEEGEEDEGDEDEDEEEEDDDDEDEDSEEDGRRRSRRRRGRQSVSGRKDKGDDGEDSRKRRGRPPKVFTPVEARINALLKGLRKFKDDDGELRVLHFEKLPDKAVLPDYYTTIRNPIALDFIKRKAKRKKYQNVDQVLADLELMFENAKSYNEEGSQVYEDAAELQKQARALAAQEKAKPDDDFRDEDGKLPLPGIEYNGEVWKVGDWVHIRNANDLSKPIVAQIYRTWQDGAGQKWVNACWYYRPEQTVHRFEKHFFENEVVKTGQYRDHRIEEVVDRCFVMFITRYHRGRPRGFPRDKEVYVCEARYNEEKYKFNKIKTWASCVPDEVREKDYEMDMFDVPRKLKKFPSPIKHLLQADAKETDDLPKPTWGSPSAPPIVGAVHRRPREANESPPPEPTPPPPTPAALPQLQQGPTRSLSIKGDTAMSGTPSYHPGPSMPGPSPSAVHYTQHFAPTGAAPAPAPPAQAHLQPMPAHVAHSPAQGAPPQAAHYQPHPYPHQYAPAGVPPGGHHVPGPNPLAPAYDHHRTPSGSVMPPSRAPMAPTPSITSIPHANAHGNQYNPPNPPKVYTLPDNMDAAIPDEVRHQYQRDDQGHVLFFTAPPRETPPNGIAPESRGLGHSVRYLAGLKSFRDEREKKRKERDEALTEEAKKRAMEAAKEKEETERALYAAAGDALGDFLLEMNRGTMALRQSLGDWEAEKANWDAEKK